MILSFDEFYGPNGRYQIVFDYEQGDTGTSVDTDTDLGHGLQIYDSESGKVLYMTLEEFLTIIEN